MNFYQEAVIAAIQGLCASPETSTRTPESIATKAHKIALAALNLANSAETTEKF